MRDLGPEMDRMVSAFARNSVLAAVAGAGTMMGGFLSSIVVARVLGVEGTGVVAFATWVVTMAIMAADLGISGALVRYIPELRAQHSAEAIPGLVGLLLRRFLMSAGLVTLLIAGYAAWSWGIAPDPRSSPGGPIRQPAFWAMVAAATFV